MTIKKTLTQKILTQKILTCTLPALAIAAGAIATPSVAAEHKKPTPEQRAERMIKQLDTDTDGKISLAEADAAASKAFAAFDSDRNGEVTRDEIKARRDSYRAAYAEMRKTEKGPERQAARAKVQALRTPMLPAMRPKLFKAADTDKNGSVSLPEVTAAVDAWLKTRDTNGDGVLDAAELARKA